MLIYKLILSLELIEPDDEGYSKGPKSS